MAEMQTPLAVKTFTSIPLESDSCFLNQLSLILCHDLICMIEIQCEFQQYLLFSDKSLQFKELKPSHLTSYRLAIIS